MNEVNTTALLERVKRLERQNKLIKLTGIVVVLVMAFVLLVGAKEKVPKEIVAEKFRVVDTQGRTRAILSVLQEGSELLEGSGLLLYDEKGRTRVGLSVLQEGSGLLEGSALSLYDKNASIILALDQKGQRLGFFDKNGKNRALLAADQLGTALYLLDENGKTVFSAP